MGLISRLLDCFLGTTKEPVKPSNVVPLHGRRMNNCTAVAEVERAAPPKSRPLSRDEIWRKWINDN